MLPTATAAINDVGGSISIVETKRVRTVIIALRIPRAQMPQVMPAAIAELRSAVGALLVPDAPLIAFHRVMRDDQFDVEVGYEIADEVSLPTLHGRVFESSLPAVKRALRATHRGPYEGLHDTWSAVGHWLEARHLRTQDPLWERYLIGPGHSSAADPTQWTTELTRPLQD